MADQQALVGMSFFLFSIFFFCVRGKLQDAAMVLAFFFYFVGNLLQPFYNPLFPVGKLRL